jgi:hypothetical protein
VTEATVVDRSRVAHGAWELAAGAVTLAGIAVAVAAAHQARVTAHSPIRPEGDWRAAYLAAVASAFAGYLVGIALLSRRLGNLAAVVAVAVAIQLTPLAAPLLLSTDAYSYWDYGRIAAIHGGNPYADRPNRWPDDPGYRRMGADWRDRTSVYGPGFTLVSEADARVAGGSAGKATLLFRLLAAAGVVVLVGATAVAARRSAFAAAFVGWNPLFALHFAGGGHNDVLMMAFAAAALALGRAKRLRLEGAAWAGALAVKAIALVFLPLRALALLRRRELVSPLVGFVVGAAVVAAAGSLAYGLEWLGVFSPLRNQLRLTSSLGLSYWLGRAGAPERATRDALLLLFVLFYVWLLREAWRGRPRLGLCAVALLVATPWLHPWYAVWAVPLAAIDDDRVAQAGALVLSAYFLQDALPL